MSTTTWWTWATVTTGGAAFRIMLDGDSAELPYTPDSLISPLLVGDRVRCEVTGRRVLVHGTDQTSHLRYLDPALVTQTSPPAAYPRGESLLYLTPPVTGAGGAWSVFGGAVGTVRTIHAAGDQRISQVWQRDTSTVAPEMWIRAGADGAWSSWARLITATDITRVEKTLEPTNNSTALADDPELVLHLIGARHWTITGMITVRSTAAEGFRMTFNASGGAQNDVRFAIPLPQASGANPILQFGPGNVPSTGGSLPPFPASGYAYYHIDGYVRSTSDGTVTLRWSQVTAGNDPTAVLQGSWLRAEAI